MIPCSPTLRQPTLDLPLSDEFIALITTHLAPLPDTCQGAVLNFHDPEYSAESGGWHPVEIRLIRSEQPEIWQLDYLTDFSWQGRVWPELAKEFDISWSQRYAWHYLIGELPLNHELNEFWTLWQDNFVAYSAMDAFTVTVSLDC